MLYNIPAGARTPLMSCSYIEMLESTVYYCYENVEKENQHDAKPKQILLCYTKIRSRYSDFFKLRLKQLQKCEHFPKKINVGMLHIGSLL